MAERGGLSGHNCAGVRACQNAIVPSTKGGTKGGTKFIMKN